MPWMLLTTTVYAVAAAVLIVQPLVYAVGDGRRMFC
jgi:hypothetical protein